MSIDFDAIIKSAMKDGANPYDLAKNFTDALNAISKEEDQKTERDKWIEGKFESITIELDEEREDYNTVARFFAAVAAEQNPEWDLATCKQFYENMVQLVPNLVKTFNQFNKSFDKLIESLNKSKEAVKGGTDRFIKKTRPVIETITDRDRIEEFLREIFGD